MAMNRIEMKKMKEMKEMKVVDTMDITKSELTETVVKTVTTTTTVSETTTETTTETATTVMTQDERKQLIIQSIKNKLKNKMKQIKSSDNTMNNILYSVSDEAERNFLRILDYCKEQFEYQCYYFELETTIFIPNIFRVKNDTFYIFKFSDPYRNKQNIVAEFIQKYPQIRLKQITLKQYRRIIKWFKDDILFESEKYTINFSKDNQRRIKCAFCGKKFVSNNLKDKYCSEECSRHAHDNRINSSMVRQYYSGYYMDIHHYVRSGWEHNIARILQYLQMDYDYEMHSFKLSNGSVYIPDFYVYADDTYYEVKGEIRTNTLAKYNMFREEYPNLNFVIINRTVYANLLKQFPQIDFKKHVSVVQDTLNNVTQYRSNQVQYEQWELNYQFYTNQRYLSNQQQQDINKQNLLTLQQLSVKLNLTDKKIHALIDSGQINYYLIDGNYYFHQQMIDTYVTMFQDKTLYTVQQVCCICHKVFITTSINIKQCNQCSKTNNTLLMRSKYFYKYYFMDIHHFVASRYAHNVAKILQFLQLDYNYQNSFFLATLNDWLIVDFYVLADDTYYLVNNHNNPYIKNKVEAFYQDDQYKDKRLIVLDTEIMKSLMEQFPTINFDNHIDLLNKLLYQQDIKLQAFINKSLHITQQDIENDVTQNIFSIYKERLNNVNHYRSVITENVPYYRWELDYRFYTNRRKLKKKDMIPINNNSIEKFGISMFSIDEIIKFIQQGVLIYDYSNNNDNDDNDDNDDNNDKDKDKNNDTNSNETNYMITLAGIEILKNDLNNKKEQTCEYCGKKFYSLYDSYERFCSYICQKRALNAKYRQQKLQQENNELLDLDKKEQGRLLHQQATNKTLENNMLHIDSNNYSVKQLCQKITTIANLQLAACYKLQNIHFKYETELFTLSTGAVLPSQFKLDDGTYCFVNNQSKSFLAKLEQFKIDYPEKKFELKTKKKIADLIKLLISSIKSAKTKKSLKELLFNNTLNSTNNITNDGNYNRDDYYTVKEACEILEISRASLNVYRKNGLLKFIKLHASECIYEKKSIHNLLKSNVLSSKKFKRTCQCCGKEFLARTSFAKFCSWNCYSAEQLKHAFLLSK